MRAVNLLPENARPGNRWLAVGREASARRILSGAGIAAAVLALAFAGLFVQQRSVVDDRRTALHDVETKLVAAQARAAAVQQARAASAARLAAFRTVVAQRLAWEVVLRDLSRVLPSNAWLQSLNATSPTLTTVAAAGTAAPVAAVATVPTGFLVAGFADSQKRVAEVLDRLALLPWLSDVTLQSSTRSGSGSTSSVQFTIGATLGSTGGR
ncbi:MAG: PilN domain-containing protein [Gaiellaceae bacterium MAG52_C11]|nr:PilN domain-containing protein [Candidatus Gaiellasilicea maunaloa]